MLNISSSTQNLLSQKVDCYAYIVEKDFDVSQLVNLAKNHCSNLAAVIKHCQFTGNLQEVLSIPYSTEGRIVHCIIVGIGSKELKGINIVERYRRALGQLVKEVRICKGTSIAFDCNIASLLNVSHRYLAEQITIAFNMAQYSFDDYITDKKIKKSVLRNVIIVIDEQNNSEVQQGIADGMIIGNAVNQARHWVDTPPSDLTPQHLVEKSAEVAKRNDLLLTVFHEKEIIEMGMGGLAAVSRGSEIDCALIILEYKAEVKDAPTLCFVGKGITFDSGGLSLKPADSMETMKEDMSGAAAVISAIDALAQLKPQVNIVAIAPTSENLPSGHATKPGDIVTFYNGKTAEIKNTDAEGRLILADALSYAVKHYKPDAIVDLATLTGACSRALGPVYSGLFSEHEDLIAKLYAASDLSGDRLWQLPMGDDYKKAITSTVADICNIGSKQIMAGASTAAHFLQYFVDDSVWAHIDIAGTAFDVPNISYYSSGGTGVGVRLLVALAMNWKK
ncbi:MAG TPA: leucyl aminopeptidase [Candidatus Babeliales bacterium]|nr:leucyl aminopeptidase [Candidatus Babeliales bacterium]